MARDLTGYVQLKCTIMSYSHEVDRATLEEWNDKFGKKLDFPINLEFVTPGQFNLYVYVKQEDIVETGYMLTHSIAVALNIMIDNHNSNLWFLPSIRAIPFTTIEADGKAQAPITQSRREHFYQPKQQLAYQDIEKTFGILGTAIDLHERFFQHYIAGMELLNNPAFLYDFSEEIFLSFYKVIERFVATEFFNNRRKPGKGDIQEAYRQIFISKGLPVDEDFIGAVGKLHEMRGRTAAHSTGNEQELTMEDAINAKSFADFLLGHYLYQRLVDKARQAGALRNP